MDNLRDYYDCYAYLSSLYPLVSGQEFYMDIFPNNECQGELNTDYSKPNAIYLYEPFEKIASSKRRLCRRIMLKDTWSEDFYEYVYNNGMTLCSGLSYRGRTNQLAHAQHMNALVFDVDGVGILEIRKFFERCEMYQGEFHRISLPRPTYTVLSGTGVHLYYVLKEPIDLFPNIKLQLKDLKYDLTRRLWDYESTSKIKSVQYQTINQGFRMVGSLNDKYGVEIVAFKTGDRVDIEYLNEFVFDDKNKVDVQKRFNSKYSLKQAKEKFPEWYERVIIRRETDRKKGKWNVKDDVYRWWLNRTREAVGGHRYYTMLATVIYADKCGISKEQLKKDLWKVYMELKEKKHINVLTEEDLNSALEIYGAGCHTTPIKYIERITGVRIDKNKRNGRSQIQHLKLARGQLAILREMGEIKEGRPKGSGTAHGKVYKWKLENPYGKPKDCIKETKLSKNTVYKWWNVPLHTAEFENGHLKVKVQPSQMLSDLLLERLRK